MQLRHIGVHGKVVSTWEAWYQILITIYPKKSGHIVQIKKICLFAVHMPGKDNSTADYMPRLLNENTERRLAPFIFHKIVNLFKVTPETDLSASALIHQAPKYISWNPDQEAFAIDGFSISWANIKFYPFPPFSLIEASISKIKQEGASGIMIISMWKTQFGSQ